ncbi:MAG TPA: hypothetical protein VFI80_09680 [Burkholderiales bacterium]|nr:hypothetical protein [Burkholderiales bacterium]
MKRLIGILLGLALSANGGIVLARGGSGHGGGAGSGHFGGGHMAVAGGARFTTGPAHFTTGPMHFTGGRFGVRPGVGVRPAPVFVGRPHFFHHRVIVGSTVVVGAPFFFYPPPYYPPVYADPVYAEPPAYVEQGSDLRYYCPDYRDYYPNVQSCPSPWMEVVPGPGGYTN